MNEHDRLPTTVHVNVSTSFCVILCMCGSVARNAMPF